MTKSRMESTTVYKTHYRKTVNRGGIKRNSLKYEHESSFSGKHTASAVNKAKLMDSRANL